MDPMEHDIIEQEMGGLTQFVSRIGSSQSSFRPLDLDGEKVIGDNLSSHININVLRLCELHNVKFVCLPPNSTHLTQPLDVAFFAPMKKSWRGILTKWKESKSGSKYPTIPKDIFPALLRELIESLKTNQGQNLKAGFEKCEIVPLSKD